MKILLTVLASLFALAAQAQTTFEHFTVEDQWPAFEGPGGQLLPNIIEPGEFFCTGSGKPVGLFECDGGKGIHIRGTELISYLMNSQPYDPRIEGLAWYDLAANWRSDYTGPVMGNWTIDPYAFMDDPETYWEGTYTGKRELVPDPTLPPGLSKWITTLKFNGYGMGDFAGSQIKATEVITTYTAIPVPWELLGLDPPGPEGLTNITIITE
jgi:hypothetical protein